MTNKGMQTSHAPGFARFLNAIIFGLLQIGLPMGPMILLTVRGRKSGQPRTTPVALIELNGRHYLFSTFGEVNWVYNLRATHEAILARGRRKQAYSAVELSPESAAPVLKDALVPLASSFFSRGMMRSWYNVTPTTPANDYLKVAQDHPVFELREA